MKKVLSTLPIILILMLCSLYIQAQQTWIWESYKVSLDLPNDFKVTKNTNNEFEAEGIGMGIYMYIFEEDISLDDMKNVTISIANEMGLQEWDAVQNVSTRGFQGKYVAGYLDGNAVLLSGLINPNNVTNFIVVIMFDDRDEVAENDAFKFFERHLHC